MTACRQFDGKPGRHKRDCDCKQYGSRGRYWFLDDDASPPILRVPKFSDRSLRGLDRCTGYGRGASLRKVRDGVLPTILTGRPELRYAIAPDASSLRHDFRNGAARQENVPAVSGAIGEVAPPSNPSRTATTTPFPPPGRPLQGTPMASLLCRHWYPNLAHCPRRVRYLSIPPHHLWINRRTMQATTETRARAPRAASAVDRTTRRQRVIS